MNLVSLIEKNLRRAVGNEPSKAVGAEDRAALGVFDADIELRAVRQAVREHGDIACLAGAWHALGDSHGFLKYGLPVGDFDIEGRGVEESLECGGVDRRANPVAAEFANREKRGEIHCAVQLLPRLQNERLIGVV